MGTQAESRRPQRAWGVAVAAATLSATLASTGTFLAVQATQSSSPVVAEAPASSYQAAPASLGTMEDWTAIADRVSPSVVSIAASSNRGAGAGSGVIWDQDGHVVTNAHVVAGATQVQVTLADGRIFDAEIVGSDASTDMAVLALQDAPEDLTPISIGDDQGLVVGDPVMAVGNPLGLAGTVTTGIVSALDRPVTTQSSEPDPASAQAVVTNAIQTSAPINPGNSGGALVDADGALVGINSAIASLSGSQETAGSIGIGFAIPVGKASAVAEQLIAGEAVSHAFLGVQLGDTTVEVDGTRLAAAEVAGVEQDSPAKAAGLQQSDAIVAVNGDAVDGSLSLVAQVRERSAGDSVTLDYVRDGVRQSVDVQLEARPDQS